MEKQFNSDSEQMRLERTSISTDGLSESPEILHPNLNEVYREEDLVLYLPIVDGHMTFHCNITGEITSERLDHLEQVFLTLVLSLQDRGIKELITWIPYGFESEERFAEFFGFEHITDRIIHYPAGDEIVKEFRYTFPELDS